MLPEAAAPLALRSSCQYGILKEFGFARVFRAGPCEHEDSVAARYGLQSTNKYNSSTTYRIITFFTVPLQPGNLARAPIVRGSQLFAAILHPKLRRCVKALNHPL